MPALTRCTSSKYNVSDAAELTTSAAAASFEPSPHPMMLADKNAKTTHLSSNIFIPLTNGLFGPVIWTPENFDICLVKALHNGLILKYLKVFMFDFCYLLFDCWIKI